MAAISLSAWGQAPQRNLYDFSFIQDANPWLTSSNAAGLGTLQVDRTSIVEAEFNKEDGGLIPVEGSDNSWLAGAQTESFVKISDRIAFHGKLSYSYFHGNNMGGHYLMDPSYNPINFLESVKDNNGVKVRELYGLLGGISYSFNGKWSIGAEIGYETGSYAKRKDARPKSNWMSLDITAGMRFAPSRNFAGGLNLKYARTTENLVCSIFGTTGTQYYTLIDYGGYFGKIESLDSESGYISTSDPGNPMINTFYGGSLQLVFGNADRTQFFNEISYLSRSGYFGERKYNSVVFCEFGGSEISYNGILDIRRGSSLHRINLYGEYAGIVNNENIYRRTTAAGENTVVEYFGQNEILDKTDIKGHLSYTGYLGVSQNRPEWEYGIDIDGTFMTARTTYYPFYRDRDLITMQAVLHGRKNFKVTKNIFTVGLAAGYYMGTGTKNSDGAYATSTSDNLRTDDGYLNLDFEYDTASRVFGTLCFRYTRLFGDKAAVYIDIRDTWNQTMEKPVYLSSGYRNSFTVTLGCAF